MGMVLPTGSKEAYYGDSNDRIYRYKMQLIDIIFLLRINQLTAP